MPCSKVKFSNQQQADFYIKKLKETSIRTVKPTKSYLCPECLVWHLTSQDDTLIERLQAKIRYKNKVITELNNKLAELKKKKVVHHINTYA